jgi:hypothetical protein
MVFLPFFLLGLLYSIVFVFLCKASQEMPALSSKNTANLFLRPKWFHLHIVITYRECDTRFSTFFHVFHESFRWFTYTFENLRELFYKFETAPMVYSGPHGNWSMKKNCKAKISCKTSFKNYTFSWVQNLKNKAKLSQKYMSLKLSMVWSPANTETVISSISFL